MNKFTGVNTNHFPAQDMLKTQMPGWENGGPERKQDLGQDNLTLPKG